MTKINVTYISDPTRYYWLDGKLTPFDIVANFHNWNLLAVPDAPEIDEDEPDYNDIEDEVRHV